MDKKPKKKDEPAGGRQTDAAEGDRQTVDEALKQHEKKNGKQ